ncbi:MAG: TIGR04086 family membrane protein [Clostridiales bacterium]|nr:TIGR04086 family membrane protein [Clostridiales bacterium]
MNTSIPKALLRSLLLSYLLSGILILATALILYRLEWKEGQVSTAVYIVYTLACLAGGFACGRAVKERRFFWGLAAGLLYFLVLLLVSCVLNHDCPPELEGMLPVCACCVGGSIVGAIFS